MYVRSCKMEKNCKENTITYKKNSSLITNQNDSHESLNHSFINQCSL